jgi:hypothetical protein
MTPHEQATKLVNDYYTRINGSPLGEVVNEEALSEAIERAKAFCIELTRNEKFLMLEWIRDRINETDPHAWQQVLNKLNEM